MGLFNQIMEKLGMKKAAAEPASPASTTPPAAPSPTGPPATGTAAPTVSPEVPPAASPAAPTPVAQPIPMVDVVAQLSQKAASNQEKLNWKTSIVDLLKLLDLDSSLKARQQLAQELNCPAELMGDSARMNMWLHKQVLGHLAANGGNIPKELL
jgi:hypothetical protein